MRRLLWLCLGVVGCSSSTSGTHATCVTNADCDGTAYSQCVDNLCEAPNGRTSVSTSGTSAGTSIGTSSTSTGTVGSTTGTLTGTTGSGGTSGLTATLTIAPGLVGGPIRQLVPVDGGLVALGPSLWLQPTGAAAWTEILDAPGNSLIGNYAQAAASFETGFNNGFVGFRLAGFAATNDVWLTSIDSELSGEVYDFGLELPPNLQDGGITALQLSNVFVSCETGNCSTLYTPALAGWLPLRQDGPLVYPDAGLLPNGAPLAQVLATSETGFSMMVLGNDLLPLIDNDFEELYQSTDLGAASGENLQTYHTSCATAFALPTGPFFQTVFVDGGWTLQTLDLLDAGPGASPLYAVTAEQTFPSGYAPVPESPDAGCAGIAGPALAVATDGGTVVYVAGGRAGGTGESVWLLHAGLAGGTAHAILDAGLGGPLVLGTGPSPDGGAPLLWIADGTGVFAAPLGGGSATPLGSLPSAAGSVFALSGFGSRMLAGTSNGVFDVTNPGAAVAFESNAGLDGLELDAFAQTTTESFVLAGGAGNAPQIWATDGGGLLPFKTVGLGECSGLAPLSGGTVLVACDGGVEIVSPSVAQRLSGFKPSGAMVVEVGAGSDTVYSGAVDAPATWVSISSSGLSVLDGGELQTDGGSVLGPVWGSPLGGTNPAVYANVEGGGFALLQGGGLAQGLPASGAQSTPLPGVVDPTDGTRFELPAFVDAGSLPYAPLLGFSLQECLASGGAVSCAPVCQIAPQAADLTLDLAFDGAGNLWALSHLAPGDPFETIRDDTSHLYFVSQAARQGAGSGTGASACPEVRLSLASPNGGGVATYGEGVLRLGVPLFDGGAIYLRGTRHPLVLSQP